MSSAHLIIFAKNPEKGKVKTRLAKSVGDDNALLIYHALLQRTYDITNNLEVDKKIFYSDFVQNMDMFDERKFEKYVQIQGDLGARMYEAFRLSYGEWAQKVIIIGSDCFELTTDLLVEAFDALNTKDFVFGPAADGGYYLMGMNRLTKSLFENKNWSCEDVLLDSILDVEKIKGTYHLLRTLNDVDKESDLPHELLALLS